MVRERQKNLSNQHDQMMMMMISGDFFHEIKPKRERQSVAYEVLRYKVKKRY